VTSNADSERVIDHAFQGGSPSGWDCDTCQVYGKPSQVHLDLSDIVPAKDATELGWRSIEAHQQDTFGAPHNGRLGTA